MDTQAHIPEDKQMEQVSPSIKEAFLFWLLRHRRSVGLENKYFPQCRAV